MSTIRACTIIRCGTAGPAFAFRTAADGCAIDRLSPQPFACNHLLPSRTLPAGWQSDSRTSEVATFQCSGLGQTNRRAAGTGDKSGTRNPEPANPARLVLNANRG